MVVFIMLDLPMLAFRMTGIDGLIELTIDQVWDFPSKTVYPGGYAAKGMLTIRSAGYSLSADHYFTTGELYEFLFALKQCYETFNGVAILKNTEGELELKCVFNKFGNVFVSGIFQDNPTVNNILSFEIKTDQTQVKDSITQLTAVYEIFGK